jgi:hypothetical protein
MMSYTRATISVLFHLKGLFRGYLLCAKNASTAVQHLAPLWGYWPDQKLVFVVGSDALATSLRSYGPRTSLRRLAQFHCFKNVTIHLLVSSHRADTAQHVPFAHKSNSSINFSVMLTCISVFIMSLLQQDKGSASSAHKEHIQVSIQCKCKSV